MSEAKFTKGEWIVDLYSAANQVDVVSECGRKTLHCNKRYFGGELTDEDLSNAHLIAAAPEMYEVLSKIMAHLNHECGDAIEYLNNSDHCINKLLAKARGEHV